MEKLTRFHNIDCPELVHSAQVGGKDVAYPQTVGFIDSKGHETTIALNRAIELGLVGQGEVALERIGWGQVSGYFQKKGLPIPWTRK